MQTFITLSELSRTTGQPVSRLNAAIQGGQLIPDGKAGASANAPVIFRADRLESIKAVIAKFASAPTRRAVYGFENERIKAKVSALTKARREVKK